MTLKAVEIIRDILDGDWEQIILDHMRDEQLAEEVEKLAKESDVLTIVNWFGNDVVIRIDDIDKYYH